MNPTTYTTPDADTIREQVQQRYGAIARERGPSSCCAPASDASSSCCSPAATATSTEKADHLGYTAEDVASAPAGAEMGLGCGNPIAIASIKPGETIVDLGSPRPPHPPRPIQRVPLPVIQ